MLTLSGAFIIDLLYVTIIESSPHLFLATIVVGRCLLTTNSMMNYFTLYSVFSTDKALKLSMVFDMAYFVSIIIMILLNEYMVEGLEFKAVYYCYLVLDGVGLVFTVWLLPKMINSKN